VQPVRTVEVVFDKWALGAAVAADVFAPVVPAGYERIPLAVQAEDAPDAAVVAPQAPTP
jgi:hypothetical protein